LKLSLDKSDGRYKNSILFTIPLCAVALDTKGIGYRVEICDSKMPPMDGIPDDTVMQGDSQPEIDMPKLCDSRNEN